MNALDSFLNETSCSHLPNKQDAKMIPTIIYSEILLYLRCVSNCNECDRRDDNDEQDISYDTNSLNSDDDDGMASSLIITSDDEDDDDNENENSRFSEINLSASSDLVDEPKMMNPININTSN